MPSLADRKSFMETSSASKLYYLDSRAFPADLLFDFGAPSSTWETREGPGVLFGLGSSRNWRETRAPRPPARAESRSRAFGFYFTMNSIIFSLFLLFAVMTE
jgi:hypothetical protein